MTRPTHVSGTIKPLEWKPGYCDEGPCFKAEDHGQPGRTYIAFDDGDMEFMQADYEARIAAQIQPAPDTQPVASSEAGELISRDAVIKTIDKWLDDPSTETIFDAIRALPAARAEVKQPATECEYCVKGLQADGETPCPCQAARAEVSVAEADDLLNIAKDSVEILQVAIDNWNEIHPDEPDEVFTDLQSRCRALTEAGE